MSVIDLHKDTVREFLDEIYNELKSGARQHCIVISELEAPDDVDGEIIVEGISVPLTRYAIGMVTEALHQMVEPDVIEFDPDTEGRM